MKEFIGIVYKATNIVNGKVYIGQTTKTFEKRKNEHLCKKKNPKSYFHKALNKYGKENFIWEIIDEAHSEKELDDKEIEWIWLNNSTDHTLGYNCHIGGTGGDTFTYNPNLEEIKQKISENHHLKGNTYEEIYGKERAKQIKNKIGNCLRGKTYEEKYGKEKANELKKNKFKNGRYIPKAKILCLSIDEICDKFKSGISIKEIAKICECTEALIKKRIKKISIDFYNTYKIDRRKL